MNTKHSIYMVISSHMSCITILLILLLIPLPHLNSLDISCGTIHCSHHIVPFCNHRLVTYNNSIWNIIPPLLFDCSLFFSSASEKYPENLSKRTLLSEFLMPLGHTLHLPVLHYLLCWSSWQWHRDHNQHYPSVVLHL